MRIAINISGFLGKDKDWNSMAESLFLYLAKKNPNHEFVFIDGTPVNRSIKFPNIRSVVLPFPANNSLSYRFWYDYKLPAFLKKEKIDLLVNIESTASLRCSIPQVLLVKDVSFFQSTSSKKNNGFIKKRFRTSLAKAKKLIAFNPTVEAELVGKKILAQEKLTITNLFANSTFLPMQWQKKETIKERYSEGKEFFLFQIDNENPFDPLILLKAFSLFKKRQQSNMQLLLVGGKGKIVKNISTKIATYKYRNEVKILDALPLAEMVDVQAAAYCLFQFSTNTIDLPLLQAMQAGVPVIILRNNDVENIEDIAFYAHVNNTESIAEQMKMVYKDENLRSRIVSAGLEITADNTVETVAEKVWLSISTL